VCYRTDGKKMVIHRDGTMTPYDGELNRRKKPVPVEELLTEDDVEILQLERGSE
jgi:hypothetical protein